MNSGANHTDINVNPQIHFWPYAIGAITIGILISVAMVQPMLPGMVQSIIGEEKYIYWFLSRSTAIVSYLTLWISIFLGILLSTRISKLFPGAYTANDLHLFLSVFGLTLGVFHGLIIIGDPFIQPKLMNIFVPFMFNEYRPFWVGLGQMGLMLWFALVISYYLKKRIGYKAWRMIHYLGFISFLLVFIHGIFSGSDTNSIWASLIYWITGGSILFLTIYRFLSSDTSKTSPSITGTVNSRMNVET